MDDPGSARRGDRPSRRRRSPGRRRAVNRGRRQRARVKTSGVVTVLAVLAVAVVAFVSGLVDRAIDIVNPPDVEPAVVEALGDRLPAVLLLTYDDADPSGRASGAIVLAHDRDSGQGTVLLVPSTTVADVPGHGSFQLGEAYALGGGPLVGVTLDNLLGIRLDGVTSVSVQGWAVLLDRAGGFEIDVRSRLVAATDAGGGEVRFEAGPQFLDGPRLAEYLTFRQETETELERLPRAQQVMAGLLDAVERDPEALNRIFSDGAPMLGTTDPDLVRIVLDELATARTEDRLTTLTLPVSALGSGREDVYRIDTGRVEQLVADRFAPSIPSEGAGVGRGVQILNGNGVPRIGQQVAERLSEGGYRIVLTGNADRFTYETTRILIYDGSDEQLAVARDVQQRLGVGEIERAGTPQSVVDVTIVVGADFPPD